MIELLALVQIGLGTAQRMSEPLDSSVLFHRMAHLRTQPWQAGVELAAPDPRCAKREVSFSNAVAGGAHQAGAPQHLTVQGVAQRFDRQREGQRQQCHQWQRPG